MGSLRVPSFNQNQSLPHISPPYSLQFSLTQPKLKQGKCGQNVHLLYSSSAVSLSLPFFNPIHKFDFLPHLFSTPLHTPLNAKQLLHLHSITIMWVRLLFFIFNFEFSCWFGYRQNIFFLVYNNSFHTLIWWHFVTK